MQEAEAYDAGNMGCNPGEEEGWMQQRSKTRQAQRVSDVVMRQEGIRDRAMPKEG